MITRAGRTGRRDSTICNDRDTNMEKSLARGVAFLVLITALQACGVGGGSGNTGSPSGSTPTTGTTANNDSTTDNGAADAGSTGTTDPGTTGGTGGSSGSGDTGGSGGTTTPPPPAPVELPGKLTINLPFTCPADQNSIVGCWVSEVCEQGASPGTSYRNVLNFDAAGALHNMYVHWGVTGCPSGETPSGVTEDAATDFVYGAQVATTTEGMVGYLLDVDQGKTKTVVGEILQLRTYGVQRTCFIENHYVPATGIVAGAQRASEGPYVIDNTKCLQRHLD